jgi:autotransporter-associated beta strand protein
MKPKTRSFLHCALFGTLALSSAAHAASGTWTSNVSGDWLDSTKWTGGNVPNAASDIATLGGDWTGQTITVTTATVGQILASDSTNNGGLLLSGGTLTLDNGLNKPVIQTSAGFTEPGGSAPFNNPLRITSVLAGSNGFEKTGAGYLSLEAANTFTGNVKLTGSTGGSFLRLTNDNNLGATDNDIEVALSGAATGLYASTGFSPTLNSNRNIITSGTGSFWVKNKGTSNLTIEGVISGSAQLRKNDSGTLTLTGANTFSGGTFVESGVLVLSGGDNRIVSGSVVTLGNATTSATLQIDGGTQTVNNLILTSPTAAVTETIRGNGTLVLQGSGNYGIGAGFTTTSLDMSGLSNFTFNRSANDFQVSATNANVVNTVNLAKAGTNNITAANVRLGGGVLNNVVGQTSNIGLGQNNNINASGEFVIGYFQGSGIVAFQSGLTNPALTVRGTGGVGATPLMSVGSTNSGAQSSTGTLNLTGGSLDVIATELNVARHFANAGGTSSTGTLTMPAGTVVATTLNIASKANTTTGAPTLTGTFNQSGGTVTAATLNLGNNTNAEAPNLIANYNLTGGELFATTIQGNGATYGGTTVRNLSINGGTLRNLAGDDLSLNGVANTATGRINVIAGASGATFNADASRTITLGTNTRLDGSGAVTKSGDGTLVINGASSTYTGTLSVNAGTLGGETSLGGNVTIGASGTLAPGNSPGTMTVAGDVTIAGTYAYEFNDTGDLADLVNVGGTLTLTDGAVTWDNLGSYVLGQKFTLFAYDGLVGTFSGYAANGDYTLDGGLWFLNYNDTTAGLNGGTNDGGVNSGFVTITAVPEPSAALLAVIGLLALLRRRR